MPAPEAGARLAAQDDNDQTFGASGLTLHLYKPGDLEALVALDDVCFAEPFRFSRASMRSFAEAKNACVVVAEASGGRGALAGFCILHVEQSRRRQVGYVVTLDVAPEQRGRGLGAELMQAVERMALADGCRRLLLHVHVENLQAIRFYERLGFAVLRRDEAFYGAGLDALLMFRTSTEC